MNERDKNKRYKSLNNSGKFIKVQNMQNKGPNPLAHNPVSAWAENSAKSLSLFKHNAPLGVAKTTHCFRV